jgi:hypothetical protein
MLQERGFFVHLRIVNDGKHPRLKPNSRRYPSSFPGSTRKRAQILKSLFKESQHWNALSNNMKGKENGRDKKSVIYIATETDDPGTSLREIF